MLQTPFPLTIPAHGIPYEILSLYPERACITSSNAGHLEPFGVLYELCSPIHEELE